MSDGVEKPEAVPSITVPPRRRWSARGQSDEGGTLVPVNMLDNAEESHSFALERQATWGVSVVHFRKSRSEGADASDHRDRGGRADRWL